MSLSQLHQVFRADVTYLAYVRCQWLDLGAVKPLYAECRVWNSCRKLLPGWLVLPASGSYLGGVDGPDVETLPVGLKRIWAQWTW